jgi:hypothetical protein
LRASFNFRGWRTTSGSATMSARALKFIAEKGHGASDPIWLDSRRVTD